MRIRCEHRIPMPADALWRCLHDAEYEARVRAALGLHEYRELERREEPDAIYRRIRVAAEIPAALAPLVSRIVRVEDASYEEEQWRSRDRRLLRWRMTPSVMADRVRVAGTLRVEPDGATHSLRILEGEIEARFFGLGGLLERAAAREVAAAYDVTARVAAELARERATA